MYLISHYLYLWVFRMNSLVETNPTSQNIYPNKIFKFRNCIWMLQLTYSIILLYMQPISRSVDLMRLLPICPYLYNLSQYFNALPIFVQHKNHDQFGKRESVAVSAEQIRVWNIHSNAACSIFLKPMNKTGLRAELSPTSFLHNSFRGWFYIINDFGLFKGAAERCRWS